MKVFLLAVVALALTAALAAVYLAGSLRRPYRNFYGPIYVEIENGMSTRTIAALLAGRGVIQYPWELLAARVLRPSAILEAGEYQFTNAASVWRVFDRIAAGDVYFYQLTVPEGSNMFDIAVLLNHAGLSAAQNFLRTARDPAAIRGLDPQAPSLEGFLFPATYRVNHATTSVELCGRMTAEFRRQWKLLSAGTAANVHDVVTLASLVEKEAAVAADRPLIASVFVNRLRQQMRLECDPTTIYAAQLENRYAGAIHRSDLDSQNDYNTYQHAGLPPGPIANPGIESLKAALDPADTAYLYFVAKPDGSGAHQFSSSLTAHHEAVRKYRRGKSEILQTH